MYQALYRSYRPEVFSEILGQEHIVKILKNQIEKEEVGHAYLLCGTRGTGKTTTARILAKAVNCLSDGERPCGECANCQAIRNGTFMDVIEIDAASNNGVDNIRELRESVQYPPVLGRKKVYIIDEAHSLTPGACNALLKTLEEPPEYVMFILATTEPEKLLPTILSRCIRLDFKRVPEQSLKEGMRGICEDRGIEITEAALNIIVTNADGSVRDGLSILDQCLSASGDKLDRDDVIDFLGIPSEGALIDLTHNVAIHNIAQALVILDELIRDGKDVKQLMKEWLAHYRALLIARFIQSPEDMLNMSTENVNRVRQQSNALELDEINRGIRELSRTINEARWSTLPRVLLELCIVKLGSVYEEVAAPVQRKAAPVKAVSQEAAPQKQMPKGSAENDALWAQVVGKARGMKGSFNLLSMSSKLIEVKDGSFTVAASNSVVGKDLKESAEIFEGLMEELTGQAMKLNVMMEQAADDSADSEKLAEKIGNTLNLNIEIK